MFSDRKAKKNEKKSNLEPGANQNRINEGTHIKGDITSSGFFRIDGTIEGNIKTPSKVVVGKEGVVIGTLYCENADVEGRLEGDLNVNELLILRGTAQVDGDLIVGRLSVEPGAVLNASCVMKGGAEIRPTKGHKASGKEEVKAKASEKVFSEKQ